jgi:hypothetical protein
MSELGSEAENPTEKITQHDSQVAKEQIPAAGDYGRLLASCFDENGKPKKDRGTVGQEFIQVLQKDEVRESIQAAMLGLRPAFYLYSEDYFTLSQLPEFQGRFSGFDETKNFKKYHSTRAVLFDENQVREVINNNRDLFPDFSEDKPLGEYLADVIPAEISHSDVKDRDNYNDLFYPYKFVDYFHPDQENLDTHHQFKMSKETADFYILGAGVLLGYPRDVLEKAMEAEWELHGIRTRLSTKAMRIDRRHGGSDPDRETWSEQERKDWEHHEKDRERSFSPFVEVRLPTLNSTLFVYNIKEGEDGQSSKGFTKSVESKFKSSGITEVASEYNSKYEAIKQSRFGARIRRFVGNR